MPRTRPAYTTAFRADAVDLVRPSGKSIPAIARALGLAEQTLRNWVHQADADAGQGGGVLTTAEREELRRLRREDRILQQEREILKKAAAFFAKESR